MKNPLNLARLFVPVLGLLVAAGLLPASAQAQYVPPASNRVSFNFNYDWKFIKSDVGDANGSSTSYNDAAWTPVSLPHTWNDDHFREWCGTANDPKIESGYYNKAWYRKHFKIPTTYSGRKILIEFQGIGRMGKFWINGTLLGTHENGIGPAGIDITPYVNFGATENILSVRVDNNQNSKSEEYPNNVAWPYGVPFNVNYGGINRDVTLHIVDKTYQTFPLYRNLGTEGTYIYAKPETINTLAKTATLTVESQVKNESGSSKSVTVEAVIVGMDGNVAYNIPISSAQNVANGATTKITISQNIANVKFWSPEYPYLYQAYTILKVGGTVVDVQKIPIGIRKFTFGRNIGLQVNGHPLYLDGYAPRSTMEWPAVGMPPDWLVDYDFDLIRQSNGNFVRPMHGAPRMSQVQAADRFGVIMVAPAVSSENDPAIVTAADQTQWEMKKDIMRDVMIYFRNNPSVLFWEGCNGGLTAAHEQEILDLRLQWDPFGGRRSGSRTNAADTDFIREFSSTMDGSGQNKYTPLWDAEYARAEGPRRTWDVDSPMLNPRWNGVSTANGLTNPAAGTVNNTTAQYIKGGYFYIASTYHQGLGLNTTAADAICDYLNPTNPGYFRLNSSEDMMLENVCKYWGRYSKSVFVQAPGVSETQGVMVGGAKIIWADSDTDGRMKDMEVARTSGAVDGVRIPKMTFYGLKVVQGDPTTQPDAYIAAHWNYPAGTVRAKMFVVSNLPKVKLQTFSGANGTGTLLADYGEGVLNILPAGTFGDMVNKYAFQFTNVAWQSGSVKAIAYVNTPTEPGAVVRYVNTVGAPAKLRITPITGPQGWKADGSDIAMFDVEVLDSNNQRCPTYESQVSFTWSGAGTFLGGYNSGKRFSTRKFDETGTTYNINIEQGINRVFVRGTRTAGSFTLNVTKSGLTSASSTISSSGITVTDGLSSVFPQTYDHVDFMGGLEEPESVLEGTPPPPPSNAPNPAAPGAFKDMEYTGGHAQQAVAVHNIQGNELAYVDSTTIRLPATLPRYLIGADYIKPFKSDGGETSSTDQYQFNLNRFSYVYQVVDAANGMANHNDNAKYEWVKLPETITVNGRSMKIYKSRLMEPFENVYLACNGKDNNLSGFDSALGFNPASNMYLLFVVAAEQELQLPTNVVSATDSQGTNTPEKAIDANPATRWNAASGASGANPKVYNIDLGRNVRVGSYQIGWNSADTKSSQYKVEISANNSTWANSLDMTANVNMGDDEYRVPVIGAYVGRYVRITVFSVSGGGWPAINELKIWGVLDTAPVASVPTVSSALTASGQAGYNFTYTVAASGGPTGFTANGLPDGWTINGNTGVISGITMSYGTFPITVSGINTAGAGGAVVNVTLAAPPPIPVISSGSTYSAQAAVSIPTASAYQITASNLNFTPISYGATGLPSGATVSTSTGKIAGTPKYPGSYPVTIKATNPGGTGTKILTFTVTPNGPAPSITSGGTASATQGVAFSYQTTATNTPTIWDATGLPAGVSRSTTTGLLSGTPTVPGTYTVTLSCSNAGGTATKTLTITVAANPDTPVITNSSLSITGNTGVAITPLQVNTTPAATTFSVSPALPAGLMLNATTGLFTGTPTAATAGTVNFTVTATKNGYSGTKPLTINIGATLPTPVINSPINAVGSVGVAFSYQITTTNPAVSYTASGLPGGVTLNTSTGLISGTPSGTGTFTATLTATNASGQTDSHTLTIGITASGVDINLALNKAVLVSSEKAPANYPGREAVDGDISTNSRWESNYTDDEWIEIDLGSSRQINQVVITWQTSAGKDYRVETSNTSGGVDGTGGTWTNFVPPIVGNTVANAPLTYNGSVVARYVRMYGTLRKTQYGFSPMEIQVFGPATSGGSTPSITSALTASGTVGVAFTYNTTASNSPTSFSATGLPAGLSVNTSTGVISGTPTASGTTNVTLRATNGVGQGPASTLVVTIAGNTPVITSPLTATATQNASFSYQIAASNSPTSFSATGLPAGLSVNTGTGLISGTPTATGTSNVTLRATNANGQGPASTLVLTVGTVGNLALNQPVSVSSFQTGNDPAEGNDGSGTTRWAAGDGNFPAYWQVDLTTSKTLTSVEIDWLNPTSRSYKYKIEGGSDGVNFPTMLKDNTANTVIGNTVDPVSGSVRYVRITVTGSSSGGFASFYECRVFGN